MGKHKFDLMHLFPFLFLLKNKAINEKVLKRAEFRLEASLAILHLTKIFVSVVNENVNGIARKNTVFCQLLRQIEGTIECFHMTSRQPYWCPQDNETAAMLVSQTNPVGVYLFSYANASFCSNTFPLMLLF